MSKIAVAGAGYVGLSLAVLLAQNHDVTVVDVLPQKVEMLNKKQSPVQDKEIKEYLENKIEISANRDGRPGLWATLDGRAPYKNADWVIVAAPTNYDVVKSHFDTSAVETVLETVLSVNRDVTIVIKSTIPVGFTESMRKRFQCKNIIFSPEFLRESKALYDNLYPSRIIVGEDANDFSVVTKARQFAQLLQEGAIKKDIP